MANEINKINAKGILYSLADEIARNKIEKNFPRKSIKILGIGNSYTRDCLRWLWAILKDAGYDEVIVGHGYIGSVTLKSQYQRLMGTFDTQDKYDMNYDYWLYTNNQYPTKSGANTRSLQSIVQDQAWDVVIFQQQSGNSGQYDSFFGSSFNVTDFITRVKNLIGNPNLKIGFNITWGRSGDSNYASKDAMHNAIQDAMNRAAAEAGVDFIINTGKAMEIARNNPQLVAAYSTSNNELLYDGIHPAPGCIQFMMSFCYAYVICGVLPHQVSFYPDATTISNWAIEMDRNGSSYITNSYLAFIAKQCAVQGQEV